MKKIFLIVLSFYIVGCGPKEEVKICAAKIRKEFNNGGLSGTVEEGCIIKYDVPNSFKVDGKAKIKLAGNGQEKTVKMPKGSLLSDDGEFIMEANLQVVKVRLINGSAKLKLGDKLKVMTLNEVVTIGG